MSETQSEQVLNIETNGNRTAPYSNADIAADHPDLVSSADTIRIRWFPWLEKVAPVELLKVDGGYTELAREMFADYAQAVKRDRLAPNDWVATTKDKYSQEWSNGGIFAGELMPDEVGSALAIAQQSAMVQGNQNQHEKTDLEDWIDDILSAEESFSEAELQAFRARGAKRGLARFKIETQTELEVYNELQKKRMNQQ
jgi:hypothetical protein